MSADEIDPGLDEAIPDSAERAEFQEQIRAHRLEKLEELRERGIEPYPVRFDRDSTAAALREEFGDLAAGTDTGKAVQLAGRVMGERRHGGLDFADLQDETGADPADGDPRRGRRRRAARVLRPRPRRLDRRRGHGDRLQPRRADGAGRQVRAALEEPAGAARRAPRPRRPRDPLPPALPRPHPRRALAAGLRDPLRGDRDDAPRRSPRRASARSRPRSCSARPAAPRRNRSSPTTTRWTST